MQAVFIQYIFVIVVILLLLLLSQRLKIAYPIVLVLGGLGISVLNITPDIHITPELVLLIFLPPLLYEAAWDTSWKEFWRWRRVITSFAFLVVIVTSMVIAFISSSIIPGFTLALGFLLGAIVSPPDAVSASAILKNISVPKRLSAIIEGESLLNDASSLIIFRFALVAVDTGRFVFREAALSFVLVIVMGIVIGLAVAYVYFWIHKWLPKDSNVEVVLTLTAPYVMYIAAETFHFSGVLAVVCGGLFLSARSHVFLDFRSRIQAQSVWTTIGFALNGLVFMMIGLELRTIVGQLGSVSLGQAITYGLLISLSLIVCRMLCTFGASYFTVFISRFITTADNRPGLKGPIILGWAGMRGVVSLAAALSIPLLLTDGSAFPQRNLILFITFVVILVTLVGQGLTLPWLIKLVAMKDPDNHLPASDQRAQVRKQLVAQGLKFIDDRYPEHVKTNRALQQLRASFENDHTSSVQADHEVNEDYKKIHLELLDKQRLLLLELNTHAETDDEIIRSYQNLLDMEEEMLRMRYESV
jgi:Na+/H+ antiporter